MKEFFFILFYCKIIATRKNDDKNKTKRMKRKLWLKAQIAKKNQSTKCEKAVKIAPILTLA
jgi:hypothetical protein